MAKLLVTGASGFIGREVCCVAAEAGHDVTGVARSGQPAGSDGRDGWMERVRWVAADVLRPETWRGELAGCEALVHCVGIIRERPARGVTFQRVNGDAAVVASTEAERAGVPAFVFLSASRRPPLISRDYIDAKRRAEEAAAKLRLRSVFLRPGFVYGAGRAVSVPAAVVMKLGLALLPFLRPKLGGSRPIPVAVVARAALRAALDPAVSGVLDADGIERLGAG